jgi:hypothetical protein
MQGRHGNGSGRFEIDTADMGGWVRVYPKSGSLPHDFPVYLSQTLAEWFRQRPHLRMRCVVPIQRDSKTVELHAWYEQTTFPALQGPAPAKRPEG